MTSFLTRFGAFVCLVLSGFDRLRFRGESRVLNNARGVDRYLYEQNVKYVDFHEHAEQLTKRLSRETEAKAREEGVPIQDLNHASIDKQTAALELARKHHRTTGRIAVVSAVESCVTYRIRNYAADVLVRIELAEDLRQTRPSPRDRNDHQSTEGLSNDLLQGFRKRDLRVALHGETDEPQERRRQGAAVTRKRAFLKALGLIVKIQKTHRYRLSAQGCRIITTLSAAQATSATRFTTCL